MRLCIVIGLASLSAGVQAAPVEQVRAIWTVQPAENIVAGEMIVGDGALILRQKLLPVGLAVLAADATDSAFNRLVAKAGSQVIQIPSQTGRVFCAIDTLRPDKTGALVENKRQVALCLVDRTADDRFEGIFEASSSTTGIILAGEVTDKLRPVDVPYEIIEPTLFKGDFWVGVRYEQYFNIYGNRMMMTDFGGRGAVQSLTAFDTFKAKGTFPRTVSTLGAQFTILAAEEKGIRIRIDKTMPVQPFGVITTTSYRFN